MISDLYKIKIRGQYLLACSSTDSACGLLKYRLQACILHVLDRNIIITIIVRHRINNLNASVAEHGMKNSPDT
jgi:hypothetical protein